MQLQDDRMFRMGRALVALLALLSLLSGCGIQGEPEPTGISIKIDSPASGMRMGGEEVAIQSTAADPGGVSWIELWVDGELIETTQAPTPLQPRFSVVQRWQPTEAGEHLVEVLAYDEKGTASLPANIILRMSGEEVQQVSGPPDLPVATPRIGPLIPTATPLPRAIGPTPTSTASLCQQGSKFVEDVSVPDNTKFAPGTEFEKKWRALNTGTCAWEAGYELVFVEGNQMGGPDRMPVSETGAGAETDFGMTLVAPEEPGNYRGDWRLEAPSGDQFGAQFYAKIIVAAPAVTTEPTTTVVLTATPTITFTLTPTP